MDAAKHKQSLAQPLGSVVEHLARSGDAFKFIDELPRPLHAKPGFGACYLLFQSFCLWLCDLIENYGSSCLFHVH
jgi:hypothetical protein